MAKVLPVDRVKLICGLIASDEGTIDLAESVLSEAFGQIDTRSRLIAFDLTHYYDDQMGSPLWRKFVSFADLVDPLDLARVKLRTNEIERDFVEHASDGPRRPVNLDPGYIEESKLVLASMKNFSHRLCIGPGVYGEITLMYRKGGWEPLEWTFPNFASGRYDSFLTEARSLLRLSRKAQGSS